MKFYPYEKGGGGEKSFSHAEGWGTTSFFFFFLLGSLKFKPY